MLWYRLQAEFMPESLNLSFFFLSKSVSKPCSGDSSCPLDPCCSLQEFTELLPRVKQSSQVKNTFLTLPWATPISTRRKSKSQDTVSISGEDLGTLPASLSVCAPYPMMRSQTPLWGKSESLRNCAQTRTNIARRCALRSKISPLKIPERKEMAWQKIYPALLFLQSYKLWQFMEQEAGASPSVRKDVALKSLSVCFSSESFTWFVYRCGSMSWWQIHAPISPTPKIKVLRWVPLCRTFHACWRVCVCVRRASRSTDGSEPGEGAVSAGYLAPSANPSAPASGGAVSKPGPDSSKEWMPSIKYMINGSIGFNVYASHWSQWCLQL